MSKLLSSIVVAFILGSAGPAVAADNSPFGIHSEPNFETKFLSDFSDIGIKVVRLSGPVGAWDVLERVKGEYDWPKLDTLILRTYNSDIEMVITIRSFNGWDQGVDETQKRGNFFIPKDMDEFLAYLSTYVERYDGDGINDAPGSPVVNYWQIENEVDSDNFWNDTAENYALLLTESYKTIKSANPGAEVIIAGASQAGGFYDFYLPVLDALTEKSFDIFDFHWYGNAANYKELGFDFKYFIADLKSRLTAHGYDNIPVWISETATYSGKDIVNIRGNPLPEQDEKKQASNLVKRYTYYIANGIDLVMWYKLIETHHKEGAPGLPNDYFENTGLINNPLNDGEAHRKLAYFTFKKLVEVLQGSDWKNTETVQDSNGIYIYKLTGNGKPVWVAWNDNGITETIGITLEENVETVKVSEAVPKYGSGEEVTDYATAFEDKEHQLLESYPLQVLFELASEPVFVEVDIIDRGDVDGDGKSDIFDLLGLLRILKGSAQGSQAADLNSDGKIDIFDLLALLKLLSSN